MKKFRPMVFESLENRALFASDFFNDAVSHGQHHHHPKLIFADLGHGDTKQSRSNRSEFASIENSPLPMHAQSPLRQHWIVSIQLPPGPAQPLRMINAIEVVPVRSMNNIGEGESATRDGLNVSQPVASPDQSISLVIFSNRPFTFPLAVRNSSPIRPSPGGTTTSQGTRSDFTNNLLSVAQVTVQEPTPHIDLSNRFAREADNPLRRMLTNNFRSTDRVFLELALDHDFIADEVAREQFTDRTTIETPSPSGMLSLRLDEKLRWKDRIDVGIEPSKKSTTERLANSSTQKPSIDRFDEMEIVVSDASPIPIPAGMLYVDMAAHLLSTLDSKSITKTHVLQAGINPLAIFQTFVTSASFTEASQAPLSYEALENQPPESSNSLSSWSTCVVGVIVAASGFLFAEISRRRQRDIAIRCQNFAVIEPQADALRAE